MKTFALLFLILLIFPMISAIEFEVNQEFSQGETLMAKISGNFLQPIQKSNIFFYRGHVNIPMEYDIKEINDDFYIYALLSGKEPNNYSIVLEDARYMKGNEISEEDVKRNFTITTEIADFSVNPGFAISNDFSIEVQNLQDNEITIEIKTKEDTNASGETYRNSIVLKSGQIQDIDFLFELEESIFKIIELSTENSKYDIPAEIPATETPEQEIFKFEPDGFIVTANTSTETKRTIYLYNTGDEPLTDITLDLSNSLQNYVTISEESISEIDAHSNVPIALTFLSDEEFEIQGHLKARQGDQIIYSQISLNFLIDYIPSEDPDPNYTQQTCAERGYPICSDNERCSSDEIFQARDNNCCVGFCEETEDSDPSGKIIGFVILIVVVGFLIWFIKKKYKGAKKPVNLLKVAKGKKK
jgi:hypothetical protein